MTLETKYNSDVPKTVFSSDYRCVQIFEDIQKTNTSSRRDTYESSIRLARIIISLHLIKTNKYINIFYGKKCKKFNFTNQCKA